MPRVKIPILSAISKRKKWDALARAKAAKSADSCIRGFAAHGKTVTRAEVEPGLRAYYRNQIEQRAKGKMGRRAKLKALAEEEALRKQSELTALESQSDAAVKAKGGAPLRRDHSLDDWKAGRDKRIAQFTLSKEAKGIGAFMRLKLPKKK